mgnify:CR=1 FL=1
MRAHANDHAIVIHFLPSEEPSSEEWENLLDQLKSVNIPGYYEAGRRMRVLIDPEEKMRVLIFLTPETVSVDDALDILRRWNIEVHDER